MILWNSPFSLNDGYSTATREYLSALIEVGFTDFRICPLFGDASCPKEYRHLRKYLLPWNGIPKLNIIHTNLEQSFRFFRRDTKNILLTTWETDRLPPEHHIALNSFDEIWVPSTFNQKVFSKATHRPVHVVPHCLKPRTISRLAPNLDIYTFYFIGTWIPRKNIQFLIDAFTEEFSVDEPVSLLIKTSVTGTQNAEAALCGSWYEKNLDEAAKIARKSPVPAKLPQNIKIIDRDDLTEEEIDKLHETSNCFISASHGEGFGLSELTAKAYGNPVIATGWGGWMDFYESGQDIAVSFSMEEGTGIYAGQQWAQPDKTAFRSAMRKVFSQRCRKNTSQQIKNNYSRASVGNLLIDRISTTKGD